MRDLREDLPNLWRAASGMPSVDGARAILFMSAKEGEGTSSVAASFALMAAARARRTAWLVDLDVSRNVAFRGFQKRFGPSVGLPGQPYDASLGVSVPLFSVPGSAEDDAASAKMLTAHPVQGTWLLVTRFRSERIRPGQQIQLRHNPQWWAALRAITDWIVVDAPSLERSSMGLRVLSQMDAVVLVMEAESPNTAEVQGLKREVERMGGYILGVVMNRAAPDVWRAAWHTAYQ